VWAQSGKSAAASIKAGRRAAMNKNRAIYMLAFTEKQAYNLFFKNPNVSKKPNTPTQIKYDKGDRPTKHIITLKNGLSNILLRSGIN